MTRGLWVLTALVMLVGSAMTSAQVPTAEQLELLRDMSPEDREALMEQLGVSGSVVGGAPSSGGTDSRASRRADSPFSAVDGGDSTARQDRLREEKRLRPDDSVLIDIDFKGMPDDVRQGIEAIGGVQAALQLVLPQLATAGCLTRASTSAGVYRPKFTLGAACDAGGAS